MSCLDSRKRVNLRQIQHKQSNWVQTSKTGGETYSDTSPYEGIRPWSVCSPSIPTIQVQITPLASVFTSLKFQNGQSRALPKFKTEEDTNIEEWMKSESK